MNDPTIAAEYHIRTIKNHTNSGKSGKSEQKEEEKTKKDRFRVSSLVFEKIWWPVQCL